MTETTDRRGRSSTLPLCCQAWAAEQLRPWTHRPDSPEDDDRPPHAVVAAMDGGRDSGEKRP